MRLKISVLSLSFLGCPSLNDQFAHLQPVPFILQIHQDFYLELEDLNCFMAWKINSLSFHLFCLQINYILYFNDVSLLYLFPSALPISFYPFHQGRHLLLEPNLTN